MSTEPSEFSQRYLRSWAEAFLNKADQHFSVLEIDWLIEEVSGRSRLDLLTTPEKDFSHTEVKRFQSHIVRRSRGEPVQHILGFTEFYGHRILVSRDALIPRPETEGLVALALDFLRSKSDNLILDIGTGSGCIAVALEIVAPGNTIIGIDISKPALDLAQRNAELHRIEVGWQLGDMYSAETIPGDSGQVDLIVSNPPYILDSDVVSLQTEVREFDPLLALTPGSDHLKPYRALAELASERLRAGGAVIVEIEERSGPEVMEIFTTVGIAQVRTHVDLAGLDRIVFGLKK